MPKVPYPYEVNWHLVTGNGSLTPICSLSKRSLSPSLTVLVTESDCNGSEKNDSLHSNCKSEIRVHIQGVRTQKFMFQFALTDRNIQARFGLRVVGES